MKVSAAVINWNNREHILPCLTSLFEQRRVELQVVVLDNASVDGSVELIERAFPGITIVRNARNLGFAAAHNIGFRRTIGEWHLVLNSDVVLDPDYVARLLDAAEDRPRIGALSGKLLRFGQRDGRDVIDSVGIEMFSSRRVWDRGTGESDQGQYDDMQQVFGCCAAAALYRRSTMNEVAPDGEIFPESYFAYYEDVDLAWLMNRRGWQSWYVPAAIGRHVRGGSTKGSATTRKLVFRNRYRLMIRNDRWRDVLRDAASVLIFELAQVLRLMRYPALLAEIPSLVSTIRSALRERRNLKRRRESFGLSDLRALVTRGSGVRQWLRAQG